MAGPVPAIDVWSAVIVEDVQDGESGQRGAAKMALT